MRGPKPGYWLVMLGFLVAVALPAQAQNTVGGQINRQNSNNNAQVQGEQTIRGVIAGVTTIGETVVNYDTGRAEAAAATFLTIIGSPEWRGWGHDPAANKDRDGDQAARDGGRAMKRRENVYHLWIKPTTKTREANGWTREAINAASTTSFDQFEVGDYVEVTYVPVNAQRTQRAENARHGRHRLFRGEAMSLTMLPHPSHANSGDKDRSRTDAGAAPKPDANKD